MKKYKLLIALMALIIGLSACGNKNPKPHKSKDPINTKETIDETVKEIQDSIREQGYCCAVAYLGYKDPQTSADVTLGEWVFFNLLDYIEEFSFIGNIDEDHMVGNGFGDVYLIIPRDDKTTVTVNSIYWTKGEVFKDKEIYHDEKAQPFIVSVAYEEIESEPDIAVFITNENCEMTWYPFIYDYKDLFINYPTTYDDEGELLDLVMDITKEEYIYGIEDLIENDSYEWFAPSFDELKGTMWLLNDEWLIVFAESGEFKGYRYDLSVPYYECSWRIQKGKLVLEADEVKGEYLIEMEPYGENLIFLIDYSSGIELLEFLDPNEQDVVFDRYG